MQTNFDEAVSYQLDYHMEKIASLYNTRVAVKKLYLSNAKISSVDLAVPVEIRIIALDVEELQSLITHLLPFTKTIRKSFHERRREFQFTGEYEGVKIIISLDPPDTCTIESYEEEEEVPEQEYIEAHTQTITRFRPAGDCLPVMDVPTKIEELEQDA